MKFIRLPLGLLLAACAIAAGAAWPEKPIKLIFDPIKDLAPVSLVAETQTSVRR